MRVLLDTTFARHGPSGTAVYVERLVGALRALGVDVVEAADEQRRAPAGGGAGSMRNLVEDLRWALSELPRRARRAGADVVHHPLVRAPARPGGVVTLHDLAFERLPGAFHPRYRAWARRAQRSAARHAAAVVCVSHTTARDAAALWAIPRAKILVAHHGPGQEPPPRTDSLESGHFLYVGDAEPRKNLATLLAAYAAYRAAVAAPAPLVLAGAASAGAAGVHTEPAPSAQRLAELYAGALALVHPALHEGFGLTPLEAMHAGVPVLAARSPGLVETCADAARFFDPRDPADLAAALQEAAGEPALRDDLSARGARRVEQFSWERSARAHLDAYTLTLEQRA